MHDLTPTTPSVKQQSIHYLTSQEQKVSGDILQVFLNHQNYHVKVRKNLKGVIVCDFTHMATTKKNVAVLTTPDYINQPINPTEFTYYEHLYACVLGKLPLKYAESELIEYKYIASSVAIKSNHPLPPNISELLAFKLTNPGTELKADESIAVILGAINLGEKEALFIEGKTEVIFVIGNSGAGKSTFINYLYGCEMQEDTTNKGFLENSITVRMRSQGGLHDEILPIEHSKTFSTFLPKFVTDEKNNTYCDCPGFFTNKNFEINIASNVNIKNAFLKVQSAKMIILIDFHTLKADRAKGLKDLIDYCINLFGSKENFLNYQSALMVGITRISFNQLEKNLNLINELKNWMSLNNASTSFDAEILDCLSERLFIYDPLNKSKCAGLSDKEEIIRRITSLKSISNPSALFRTSLTSSDLEGLEKICMNYENQMNQLTDKIVLSIEEFKKLAEYQRNLKKLGILDHPFVTKLINRINDVIVSHFKLIVWDFNLLCANETVENFQKAQALLKTIKEGLVHFDQVIREKVYQFFDTDASLQQKELSPIRAMQSFTIKETKNYQKMHDLILAANLEAEKLGERFSENSTHFSEQTNRLEASLKNLVTQLEKELMASGLSADRLAQSHAIFNFANHTLQVITDTSFQLVALEKKGNEINWKAFKGALELALHARKLEIDYVKEQFDLWDKQKNHEWMIAMNIHALKLKEEIHLFDQLLEVENHQRKVQGTEFKRDVKNLRHEMKKIKQQEKLIQNEYNIYQRYQQQMCRLKINGIKECHLIDVEARSEMAKILACHFGKYVN